MEVLFACLYFVCGTEIPSPDYTPVGLQEWSEKSPDEKLSASVHVVPDARNPERTDLDGSLFEIVDLFSKKKDQVVRFNLYRIASEVKWSPDSRYIVMTTVSAGGHSPWHFETYVYCADDKTLREMDDLIGSVVDPEFKFTGEHTVIMQIAHPDFDSPAPVKIDLDTQVPRMKKEPGA